MISQFNKQDIDQKLKDGKIMAAQPRKEDMMIVGDGGKKKKGKKAKNQNQQKNEAPEAFNIDFAVIGKFGLAKVSPPISPDELDGKIKELQE